MCANCGNFGFAPLASGPRGGNNAPCSGEPLTVEKVEPCVPAKPSCNDCYFRRERLCALPGETICPTFRAVTSAGQLLPPRQPRLVMRPAAPLASSPAT